jgi:hypothetical protein
MLVSVITGSDAQTLAFTQSAFSYCITNLAPGAIVGTIGATIPSGTTGTWSLTGGNSNFAINPTSGLIVLTNSLTAAVTPVQTPIVKVTTAAGQSISTTVVVRVTPCTNPTSTASSVTSGTGSVPVFSSSSYSVTLTSCTLGSSIGTASATSSTTVTYSLGGTASSYFAVNPTTGQIYLNTAPTSSPVTFTILAKNSAGTTTASVTVYATVCATTTTTKATATTTAKSTAVLSFQQTSYSFAPACAAGTFIGQVITIDSNPITSYTIAPTTPLTVDALGNIAVGATALTPSSPTSYSVTAVDSKGNSASVPVTLTLNAACTAGSTTAPGVTTPTTPTTPAGGGPIF